MIGWNAIGGAGHYDSSVAREAILPVVTVPEGAFVYAVATHDRVSDVPPSISCAGLTFNQIALFDANAQEILVWVAYAASRITGAPVVFRWGQGTGARACLAGYGFARDSSSLLAIAGGIMATFAFGSTVPTTAWAQRGLAVAVHAVEKLSTRPAGTWADGFAVVQTQGANGVGDSSSSFLEVVTRAYSGSGAIAPSVTEGAAYGQGGVLLVIPNARDPIVTRSLAGRSVSSCRAGKQVSASHAGRTIRPVLVGD